MTTPSNTLQTARRRDLSRIPNLSFLYGPCLTEMRQFIFLRTTKVSAQAIVNHINDVDEVIG